MKSTTKTRKESIEKITSFMNGNLLTPEETSSLRSVLDVLEDAQEYAALWRNIDNRIGINKVSSIMTMKPMVGPQMDIRSAEDLCDIISSLSYNVSHKNL